MLSHYHRCIFVHIPKVAGQSIEQALIEDAGGNWQEKERFLLRPNTDPLSGPPRLAHLTAAEYKTLQYVSPEQFNDYFKFSFVRNPWERLVSEYNYRKALGIEHFQRPFKDLVMKHLPSPSMDNHQQGLDLHRHVIPQHNFVYNEKGECLVDFVGRFEQLQNDFATVAKRLELKSLTLPHRNSTANLTKNSFFQRLMKKITKAKQRPKKRHYSEFYDNESRDFVAQLYRQDIKVFDYQFDS